MSELINIGNDDTGLSSSTWEVEGRGSEAHLIYNKFQISLGYMRSPFKDKSELINIGNANSFHSILQGWSFVEEGLSTSSSPPASPKSFLLLLRILDCPLAQLLHGASSFNPSTEVFTVNKKAEA